ncbi:MAG: hypothetical protein AB1813_18845 [Verrucomicrobiota bacterium]
MNPSIFGVIHTDGFGDEDPPLESLVDLYDELLSADAEHGDVTVSHDSSGWGISAHRDGRVVLGNIDDPQNVRHMIPVPKERVIELWKKLIAGDINQVLSEPWKPGYGTLS